MRRSFSHFSDHQGFALPVVLGILLFLSLLFLALDHLLKVSATRVHAQLISEIARQNARAALEVGMADLKSQAQSCRIVTAAATILEAEIPPQNAHWTGLWKVESGRPVFSRWLVSGENLEEMAAAEKVSAEEVSILADYGLNDACPSVAILLHGRAAGHYAYWIGDENLKARINLPEPSLPCAKIAQQFGGEWLGEMGLSASQRTAIVSERNFRWLLNCHPKLANYFHDITLSGAGIFTNPLNGRNLEDLSVGLRGNRFPGAGYLFPAENAFPEPPPTWGQLVSHFSSIGEKIQNETVISRATNSPYLFRFSSDPNIETTLAELPLCNPNSLLPKQLGIAKNHGIGPVILEFSITAAARVRENRLEMLFLPRLVLWNPYEVGFDAADYQFRWHLADLEIPDGPGIIYGKKAYKLGVGRPDCLWMGRFRGAFSPGEIKVLTLSRDMAADDDSPGMLHERDSRGAMVLSVSSVIGEPLSIFRRCDLFSGISWSNFSLRLEDSRGNLFQEIYDLVDAEPQNADYSIPADGKIFYLFSWNARAKTDSSIRWLANYNPRAVQIRRNAFEDRTIPLFSPSHFKRHFVPWDSVFNEINSSTMPEFSPPKILGSYSPILFAVPEKLWSLGWLQHLNLAPFSYLPCSSIGNSWGNPRVPRNLVTAPEIRSSSHHFFRTEMAWDYSFLLNEALYDNYFVSGFDRLSPAEKTFTLCDFVGEEEVQSANGDVASLLLNRGAFNVNSTSPLAWELLLRGAMDSDGRGDYSFPRHGNQSRYGEDFLRRRCLSLKELRRLAECIVEEIRRHGPFCTPSHFINRQLISAEEDNDGKGRCGLLQRAIENAGINENLQRRDFAIVENRQQSWFDEGLAAGFANENAPGYLTSADLLQYLGNSFTTHSDSFLIRGYGDYCRGKTVLSRACCEMLVQRLPNRSWKRLYFRWID